MLLSINVWRLTLDVGVARNTIAGITTLRFVVGFRWSRFSKWKMRLRRADIAVLVEPEPRPTAPPPDFMEEA